jgi:hypothetical protein
VTENRFELVPAFNMRDGFHGMYVTLSRSVSDKDSDTAQFPEAVTAWTSMSLLGGIKTEAKEAM